MICNLYDLPPDRDRIHALVMKRRHSGLSPPEEEELALLEGGEAEHNLPREEHAPQTALFLTGVLSVK